MDKIQATIQPSTPCLCEEQRDEAISMIWQLSNLKVIATRREIASDTTARKDSDMIIKEAAAQFK